MYSKNRIYTVQKKVEPFPIAAVQLLSLGKVSSNKLPRQHQSWLLNSLKSYCDTTSLHGFNYITNQELSLGERIFWFIVVILAIIVSIILVSFSYKWINKTPVITVIENSHYPAWNLPFPAVTICNLNQISRSRAFKLAKRMKRPANLTEKDLIVYFRMSLYFSATINFTKSDYERLDEILIENNYTALQLINELTPNCMDMISKCTWKGMHLRCDSLFQRINTTQGVCCSFNYFGMKFNSYAKKLIQQTPKSQLRNSGCSYPTGLTIFLNPEIEDYYRTYIGSYGFRLFIHDGHDYPDENAETNILTAGCESFVRISPRSTYATTDVKRMEISRRKCLFANDRRLNVMQRYSYINCLSECRSQIFYERCQCVPVNLPNNGSYPQCTFSQIHCIIKSRVYSSDILFRALPHVNQTYFRNVQNTFGYPCNCLPDCEWNQYPAEATMGKLNKKFMQSKQRGIGNSNQNDYILLHVFFNDLISIRYRTDTANNWLSVLACFGGLLGLIMGFSIVTAFEFIYYLTLRPIFNYVNGSKCTSTS